MRLFALALTLLFPATILAAPADFDGDGKSDFTLIRSFDENECLGGPVAPPCPAFFSTVEYSWLTKPSKQSSPILSTISTAVGGPGIAGQFTLDANSAADLDNDGITDRMLIYKRQVADDELPQLLVQASRFGSRTTQLLVGDEPPGAKRDRPIVVFADVHGDGSDDPLIFSFNLGIAQWYVGLPDVDLEQLFWGLSGDVPVPADYSGDGRAEIAVWRNSDGYWWIRDLIRREDRGVQWGLPGDLPMPGDYDGDKKADLAVWRPSDGYWHILTSTSGYNPNQALAVQFGLPREDNHTFGYSDWDIPVKGDWDGDGKLDLAVYRPQSGTWFYRRSSDLKIISVQWGLQSDLPLGIGISDRRGLFE